MINIAILGHGVVGTGTAHMIEENEKQISAILGDTVRVKYILDLRDIPDSPWADRIVHDYSVILNDPEIKLVAELIGGSHPAFDFELAAINAKKHVVTSNKECVSVFGDLLTAAARKQGVNYGFEASCGGGIPLISVLSRDLSVNRITKISGILNGTTNFILTGMYRDGSSFTEALDEARTKGYAERDPSADIDGIDAARKINIIGACLTGELHKDSDIPTEGISAVRSPDVYAADKAGYSVKLLGSIDGEYISVSPWLVPFSCPLSRVDDVFNAILIGGNYVGDVMLYGRGAGAEATAAAVVSDIVAALSDRLPVRTWKKTEKATDFSRFTAHRYVACDESYAAELLRVLPSDSRRIETVEGECAFITSPMTEAEASDLAARFPLRSLLRVRES